MAGLIEYGRSHMNDRLVLFVKARTGFVRTCPTSKMSHGGAGVLLALFCIWNSDGCGMTAEGDRLEMTEAVFLAEVG